MGRPVTGHATELLPPGAHRTPEWYDQRRLTVSASEVAAILGLSPYTSAFDLWWEKQSGVDSQPDNRDTRRGRRYERLILEDFTEEHPEFVVASVGLCVNNERPWQTCSPDGLVYEAVGMKEVDGERLPVVEGEPVAVVEAKSAARRDEWGEPGTDDIPVYYRTQVLWQMDVLGLSVAYVPVIFGFDYREYVVTYHEADVLLLRKAAREFLDSLADGTPPDIDAHTATARRLKVLHPTLDDTEVTVPDDLADAYATACAAEKQAQADKRLAENLLRDALGNGRYALRGDGRKVCTRSVYDVPERTQVVKAHTINKLIPARTKKDTP